MKSTVLAIIKSIYSLYGLWKFFSCLTFSQQSIHCAIKIDAFFTVLLLKECSITVPNICSVNLDVTNKMKTCQIQLNDEMLLSLFIIFWYLISSCRCSPTIVHINMGTLSLCKRRTACVLSQLFFQSVSFWCLLCPSRLWMWLLSEAHLPVPVATTTEATDLCWGFMAAPCPACRWAEKQNSHRQY